MARVIFENIYKLFGDNVVVNNFNFEVHDKEFVVIVGPSGCGKSTTLRMVAGLETISDGNIKIGDTIVNDVPPKDRDIAMVFQNYALYPHMNVYQNMAFGLKLRKVRDEEIKRRVDNAAGILGIEELMDRKPKQLSGGQRQRVAVGRSIVREPAVFLFDEPLSNLDAKLRVQMRAEIKKLHSTLQTTMMYVTHDQVEAMTMGDRIVILKDGILQQSGSPMHIYRHPENVFVAGFIGSPSMNFISAEIESDTLSLGGFKIPKNNFIKSHFDMGDLQNCICGIRPESLILKDDSMSSEEYGFLKGDVDLVETTGSEALIHCRVSGSSIIVRLSSDHELSSIKTVDLGFSLEKINLFDSDTEKSLRVPDPVKTI